MECTGDTLTCISTVLSKRREVVLRKGRVHCKIVVFGVQMISIEVSEVNTKTLTTARRQ